MPRKSRKKADALSLLKADHDKVKKMFKQFEKLKEEDSEEKAELVRQVCTELKIHTQLEEEIFYPALREALEEQDLLEEAAVEHDTAKALISQLEQMEPDEETYDAKFTVLGEYVNHHISEEQKEMFPKARKAHIDLVELGERIAARKDELMAGQEGSAALSQ